MSAILSFCLNAMLQRHNEIWTTIEEERVSLRLYIRTEMLNLRNTFPNITALIYLKVKILLYEGWNFNSVNYLFTTDTK